MEMIEILIRLSDDNAERARQAIVRNMGGSAQESAENILQSTIEDFIRSNVRSSEDTIAIQEFRATYEPDPFEFIEEEE